MTELHSDPLWHARSFTLDALGFLRHLVNSTDPRVAEKARTDVGHLEIALAAIELTLLDRYGIDAISPSSP